MFTSQFSKQEIVIDDTTNIDAIEPVDVSKGLELGLRGPGDYEYGATATPFPQDWLIPKSEWEPRIKEMEERKSRTSDIIRLANLPPKDQDQTNYCWINAPCHCVEIIRVAQNEPMVILSPASAGAQIKQYQNVGGWGKEGLEWIVEKGLVPVDRWPANAIDKKYATPDNLEIALDYRVTEWTELKPRTLDQLVSILLRRIPVAVGFNWWGHEVTAIDVVWIDGTVAIRIRNSWKDWGEFGFGLLKGSRMLPDDAVAPRVAIAA